MSNQIIHFIIKTSYQPGGWGNGYVAIPEGHPLYQVSADDLGFLNVHGGVTVAMHAGFVTNKALPKAGINKSCWIIGFDTGKPTNDPYNHSKEFVMLQTLHLARQVRAYGCLRPQLKTVAD